jgi:prevent-host-death family protein
MAATTLGDFEATAVIPLSLAWRSPLWGVTYILYDSGDMLYSVVMSTMAVSEAREKLSDAVEAAQTEPVFLERYGRPAAVLVSPERYEELMEALEDAEDVAAFDAAMGEDGANIPWEQVKADLGWT